MYIYFQLNRALNEQTTFSIKKKLMPKTSPFHQKNPNIVEEAFELKPLYKIVHGYIPFCLMKLT